MFNKKIFLTTGSIVSIVTPIVAVIACSPSSNMGEKEVEALKALTSQSALIKVKQIWIDEVFSKINDLKTPDKIKAARKEMIKAKIAEELRKDDSYLIKLSNQIASGMDSNAKDIDQLREDLSLKYELKHDFHSFADWEQKLQSNSYQKTFNDFVDTYFLDKEQILLETGFLQNIDLMILTKEYLKIKKSDWMKVFGDEEKNEKLFKKDIVQNSQQVFPLINENMFPLTLAGMKEHYAYQWRINISDEDLATPFLEKDDITAKEMVEQMIGANNTLTGPNVKTYSQEYNKLEDSFSPFKTNTVPNSSGTQDIKDIYGFNGVVAMPTGSEKINFSFSNQTSWKEKTTGDDFVGFIQKSGFQNKLLSGDEKVKYLAKETDKTIDISLYKGIIPTFNNSSNPKVSTILFDSTYFDIDKLLNTFVLYDSGLWEDARAYYVNPEGLNVSLEIIDPYIKNKFAEAGLNILKK